MYFLQKGSLFTSKLLVYIGLLFFMGISVISFWNTIPFFSTKLHLVIALVVAFAGIMIISHVLTSFMTRKQFLIMLVVVAASLRVGWIYSIDTQPVSDFADMYNAAILAASGDFSFGETEYFMKWVYQIGFTMYEALIIKLFGTPIIVLKLFNVLFSVGTGVLLYFIAAKIFNEFCARIASFLYALYVPYIIMCSVLTNQHLSTFLFLMGCYLLVDKGLAVKYNWLFIGLCFGLGHIIRPLGSFYIVGFIVYIVLFQIVPLVKQVGVLPFFKRMVGVIAVFYVVQQIVSYSFIGAGITKYPLINQEPYWKFMVGLNQQSNGGWSQQDVQYSEQYELGEERNEAQLQLLKERLEDKSQLLPLFARKMAIMWGTEDSAVFWSLIDMDKSDLRLFLTQIERITYILMAIFGVIAFLAWPRTSPNPGGMLFLILLAGYALLHVVIEVQTRYRLDILPSVILLQSFGIYILYSWKTIYKKNGY
jgi:hypothetical protein